MNASKTDRQLIASLALAISALQVGSDHEAAAAALRGGALARKAGHSLDLVWESFPECQESPTWNHIVDGYCAE